MRIHLIAVGGSAMHNMAIALHKKGYQVTGSDDEIFEPSKSRLDKHGLLPEQIGWDAGRITTDIDAVILGMHAREDNPELKKAQDLGLKIYSYPEYIYEQCKDKKRVVIGGSHGKTSTTAMILHVLGKLNVNSDYMVGAQLEGFDTMVKLTKEAKVVVLEGDEYLSSPIDRRPKFHLYYPDVAVITGIAWDHINVFPTFENYVEQFDIFTSKISANGSLIYCELDEEVSKVGGRYNGEKQGYGVHNHKIENGVTHLLDGVNEYPIEVFGDHNLQNLNAALHVCLKLGVSKEQFYDAIGSFKGASKRLELLKRNNKTAVYKDFAHSPSKLKATSSAMKKQFSNRELVACMELHTFSSLNKEFLKEYNGTMNLPDKAIVFFSPKAIEHKRLEQISEDQVKNAFGRGDLEIYTTSDDFEKRILSENWEDKNLLLMSSGNFGGLSLEDLAEKVVS